MVPYDGWHGLRAHHRRPRALRDKGHHAVHVVDVGLATATDTVTAARAEADGLIVVTADTDFPMHLALRRATSPSIVLLRQPAASLLSAPEGLCLP